MVKRPTQADVARLAGTSTAVVSTVINGRRDSRIRCSEATRERIWSAVRELGYAPNPVAQRLVGARNRLLGVFTYEHVFPADERNFYHGFLVGVEEEAQEQDYDLMLFTRVRNGRRAVYHNGVNSLQIADGAVLFGGDADRAELAALVKAGFPFVYIGHREIEGMWYVGADYLAATRDVAAEFLRAGHRRIVYVGTGSSREIALEREQGFRAACRHGEQLVLNVSDDDIDRVVGEQLAAGATAFIAESGGWARAIKTAIEATGRRVPTDCSVAGLGGDADPGGFTTFAIPRQEMGRQATRLLCERLDDPSRTEPRRMVFDCTVVRGDTLAAPPTPEGN